MEAADRAPEGVKRVRAGNPSPLTLDGTNTYVVAGWVVDPGPDDAAHRERVVGAAAGWVQGVVLTHDHPDHAEGAGALAERVGVPVRRPADGERVGPFTALATPGHAPEHVCLLLDRVCFTGDTVLGAGSVFVAPGEGAPGARSSLGAYLESLERLRALDLDVLCPGHGPFVWTPRAKIDEYREHRLERERSLLAALESGARSEEELLDRAWSDVPDELRGPAAWTLRAHLEKLAEEGRLPEGVQGAPA